MTRKSIRFRLTIWYSLVLCAGLGSFALAIWFSMSHSLARDLDRALADQARGLAVFIGTEAMAEPGVSLPEEIDEYSRGLPRDTYVQVLDAKGSAVFDPDESFPWLTGNGSEAKFYRVRWQHKNYRLFITSARVKGQLWRVSIADSLEVIDKLLARLRLFLLAFIPGVILVAGAGGAWLSRRAMKPVAGIISAARSIGIGNLSERLAVPQTGDELQLLSETWNSMLSRLEAAVRRLSRFTADASHELRTPLGVIRATAEIAARKSRSASDYRQALEQVVLDSERMTTLLDDLLFLARCDAESVEMPMAPVEMASLIDGLCRQLRPLAESRTVQLIAQLPPEGVYVFGNDPALRRLVLVLLDNAIKYSKDNGTVRIHLHPSDSELCLEVADNGPGIAETDLPYIFERFYRSSGARDSRPRGYGLGLSLAKGIARRHQACIDVESIPNEGATFRVTFQRLENHAHPDVSPVSKNQLC